ncbi:phosphate ABC transporter permease subunit PstC [Roseomonas elaeocarpi]|uniref:Phosphate transport system permease protein n=1 Tax=Roseomonas elaeocarpi TaxID=907779 RepID=A0ABV6JV96_9PROT
MTDTASHLAGAAIGADPVPPRASRAANRGAGQGDAIFALLCRAAGVLVLLLLSAIIVELFLGGLPAFRAFGAGFLTNTDWDPVQEVFGAGVPVYGTLLTAVLALIMAVPVAFGIAFFLTELAPAWLKRPVGTAIELLAAVPSIIYGMWGFFVIVPIMASTIQPAVIDTLGEVPGIGMFFSGAPFGTGLFTAALILAIMILPFVAATMRDVFEQVPAVYKESAYGLGATTWEVMRGVVLPYTRISVVGGIMLGLGRALGETMAVTFVIGNANRITPSLFGPGNTIASIVALEFGEASAGSLKLSALLALGFILFVISFAVLALSRWLLRSRLKG